MKTNQADVLVVGKGLIGSAAAKYLSATGKKVIITGPDEPDDYEQAAIFSSHYDQARVQRLIGKDEAWTRLNVESANAYPFIEKESGIRFHTPVGCLYVNPHQRDEYLQHAPALATQYKTSPVYFDKTENLRTAFPDFQFPQEANGMFEPGPSGYINPRLLLKAQLHLFREKGGMESSQTIQSLSEDNGVYTAVADDGTLFHASSVVLAPGSFANFFPLSPRKPAMQAKSEVVLLARLSEDEIERLKNLPSLLYEINTPELDGIYLLPPVEYPDGETYLKLGCNMPEDIYFNTLEEVQDWFRHGDSEALAGKIRQALYTLMPALEADSFITKRCIISRTEHGRPYIGSMDGKGLYFAGGCNGYSAMCSEAIGLVTASVLHENKFPDGYQADWFKIMYQ
ncbi:MAG: FAD-binding oxidoreductase [Chitinophagaceae bacterium]|nr:FAD-binding oxidoreductase [Chitinophagaceae bacterium]